ncbi:MAG: SMC-Scp complex subunit ScpB [Pseudomonadota bacterium]
MAAKIPEQQLKQLIEAAIFVADHPLTKEKLRETVLSGLDVSKKAIDEALESLRLDYLSRGVQLVKVASGYRFQSNDSLSPWLGRLWQEHAPRYSRAMLETLALIAYRQPVTRGDIEDVRGVAVSSNIVKTMVERDWVKVVGHKEVPGRPALYATTANFLNYFGLKSLSELPSMEAFESMVSDEVSRDNNNFEAKARSDMAVTSDPTIKADTQENQIH